MYLYGASGHAKVVIDILKASGLSVDGLFDDNPAVKELLGFPVLYDEAGRSPMIVSIGDNKIRKRISEKLTVCFGSAIYPGAIVSDSVTIEYGSVVMQGAVIQSCSIVGKHCIINTGTSVDHECVIGDYAHLSPHCTLCGNVTVGEGAWIGAGSVILPGIKIGKWSIIGAGSVVSKDIPDNVLAVGNRCRVVKEII